MSNLQKHITWIFLLIGLASSVWETVAVNMSTTDYQTEENNNVTITMSSQTQPNMSLINLICYRSKPHRVLYRMINGVEYPESQQFAGRVQLDRDALKKGRVEIHLCTVTAKDSGNYWCDLAADYDKNMRRWQLMATERFVLNVAQNNNGENSDKSVLTATKGHRLRAYPGVTVALGLLAAVGLGFAINASVRCLVPFLKRDQRQEQSTSARRLHQEPDWP